MAILASLTLLLGSVEALGADKIKMRWLTSSYGDEKGVGLRYPEGVACGDGSFVVADTGNSRILRYRYEKEALLAEAEFPLPKSSPVVVQVNSKGDIYFLDSRERRVATLGSGGEGSRFLDPKGLPGSKDVVAKSFKIDSEDNIYVLDVFSARVLVLEPDGKYSRHIPFPKSHGFFTDLAVDRLGNVFLLDGVEAVVYVAMGKADHFSALTESLKEYMNFPTSLATDKRGTIFLIDQYGSGVALVGQDGSFLGRKLGMGWKESRLYYPSQICISQDGKILIADRSNSRVQLFSVGED